jgi:hypothetical protein
MAWKRWLAAAAGMLLIAAGGALLLRRWIFATAVPPPARTLVRGRPYTMTLVTVAQDSNGRRHATKQRTVAVRGDGAEVWIVFHPGQPRLGPLRRIVRPDGRTTLAIERLSLRLTQYIPVTLRDAGAAAGPRGPEACRAPDEAELGSAVLAGVPVQGAVREAPGRMRTEHWDAPAYDCLTLAVRHEHWREGRWQFLAEQRAVWFRLGEPDARFFDEAWFHRLRETSPAQLVRRIAEASGVSPADCPACYRPGAVEEWDRQYFRNQAPPRWVSPESFP